MIDLAFNPSEPMTTNQSMSGVYASTEIGASVRHSVRGLDTTLNATAADDVTASDHDNKRGEHGLSFQQQQQQQQQEQGQQGQVGGGGLPAAVPDPLNMTSVIIPSLFSEPPPSPPLSAPFMASSLTR